MANPVGIWRETENQRHFLGQKGKIVSLTKIQTPVEGFEEILPYFVAVIKLTNGRQITGQLVKSTTEPKIGQKVIAVWRLQRQVAKDEVLEYGIKWKIIE